MSLLRATVHIRLVLTLLIAMALAGGSMAHRLPSSAELALASAATVLGGALDICGQGGKSHETGASHCALCPSGQGIEGLAWAAPVLPATLSLGTFAMAETRAGPTFDARSHGARDPPLLTL